MHNPPFLLTFTHPQTQKNNKVPPPPLSLSLSLSQSMAFHSLLLFSLIFSFLTQTHSRLTPNYYDKTCPDFEKIVRQVVTDKQLASPTTAAATLRLFFHDCMVEGCDASILIASNSFNKAERDSDINLSLAGDGFDVITRIKTNLELTCPGIVSCADILVAATRNLINMVGGPYYPVRFGRKDGFVSRAEAVEGNLARANMSLSQIINLFAGRRLNVQEMVALAGSHTIGFSHCKEFSNRLFKFSPTSEYDPSYNPQFAEGLRKLCANYTQDPQMSAFNDVMTPGKFDNMYFRNLQRGLGLLPSDQAMAVDRRTRPLVDLYAANQTRWFDDFSRAMEKVSLYNVKMGRKGEVRRRCDAFNNLKT
ncbi:putative peroxidase [Rosa chinensis]|uniref:Peroxidase n=2 Tax=Rosa chinensis TaxID=74649 RepID=A0A2P6R493_ROSCH|nr:putative peroxidase [Rosa chinensis]